MPSKGNLIIGDNNTIKTGSANNLVTGGSNTVGHYVDNGLIIGNGNIIGSTTAAVTSRNTGAVVLGTNGAALRLGETVVNSGGATAGAAQSSIVTMVKTIPSGTTSYQECFIQGEATNLGRIVLPNNSITGFRIRSTAFVASLGGYYMEVSGAIQRSADASTALIVGTNATKALRSISGKTNQWRVQATADTSNGSLKVEVKTNTSTGGVDVDFVAIVELFQSKA